MIAGAYRLLTTLGVPVIRLVLARRRAAGKEDPARSGERRGLPGRPRPPGPLVWVHGASVGESLSALPLIERLVGAGRGIGVLVTTGTVTSARLMADRLPAGAFHQYAPVDAAPWVARFLDHWRPDLALWLESELWPNLVRETRRRGVPMVLVNGRMSARSLAGWRRWPGLARPLLDGFALCLVQSEADGARFAALGARRVACPGNLKFAAPPLPADADELARLRTTIGARPLWLAASTHAGEERVALAAHRRLAPRHPGLLTVVVPRHPRRGPRVAAEAEGAGLGTALRSKNQPVDAETEVYVADTVGELGLFYRLAPVVFVGGSLVRHGGQNPIEPAHLDCAVVHGPHMENFAAVIAAMKAAGATEEVADEEALAAAVDRLLAEPDLRRRRAAAALGVARAEADVLERIMAQLAPLLADLIPPEDADGAARARA